MFRNPLLLPLGGMIAGLCAAHHLAFELPAVVVWLALAGAGAAFFLHNRLPFTLLLAFFFFAWGTVALKPFLTPDLPAEHVINRLSQEPVIVEGVIDSRPEGAAGGERIFLQTERVVTGEASLAASGRLLLYVKEGRGTYCTGDRVRFSARLRRPENYGLPGEFDYRRHLAYRDVFVTASLPQADRIVLMREGVDFPVRRWFDLLAARLGTFISERFPGEGGVLRALLIGDRGLVPDDVADAYTRAGVNHILSISGFHVGVIGIVLYQLLFRLLALSEYCSLRWNLRRLALVATLPPVVFYLFLSGAAPATVRSVVMLAAFTMALVLEREIDPLNTLVLAAFSLLACYPQDLFDLSFQLSFLALWGLVVLPPLMMRPLRAIENRVATKLLLFLAASVAATAVTLLPVAQTFHRVSLAGILTNFLIVPLLGYGAVIAGFAALPLILLFPGAAEAPLWLAAMLVRVSDVIITTLARIPPLPLRSVSAREMLVFYLGLTAMTVMADERARKVVGGIAVAVLLLFHLPADARGNGTLSVTFLSLGQGESTLVTFPNGRRMLVDGGGSLYDGGMDVGERLLVPALWNLGVDRIDYVVMTHPHPDHMKGLIAVAASLPIGEFWESGEGGGGADYGRLRWLLADRGVAIRRVDASSAPLAVGGVKVEPLWPAPKGEGEKDANEGSLVMRLAYGATGVLLTGDIGEETEERLLADPARLRCTVLKVPHHGSRHSSSKGFLDASAPRVALISAGKHNSFGLPAVQTLQRLARRRIAVYRTDRDGTIEVVSDGRSETVRTFVQGHFH